MFLPTTTPSTWAPHRVSMGHNRPVGTCHLSHIAVALGTLVTAFSLSLPLEDIMAAVWPKVIHDHSDVGPSHLRASMLIWSPHFLCPSLMLFHVLLHFHWEGSASSVSSVLWSAYSFTLDPRVSQEYTVILQLQSVPSVSYKHRLSAMTTTLRKDLEK